MKRLISLLLVLSLLLPVLAFAEMDEEELSMTEIEEDIDLDEEENEEAGEGFELSSGDEQRIEDITENYELDTSVDPEALFLNENLPDNVLNILLIGVDARGTKELQKLSDQMRRSDDEPKDKSVPKRSDVLIILSVNLDDFSIKLSSIARNTFVEIPDRKNKTIIANSFGHAIYKDNVYQSWIDTPQMCLATVNKNFQMNIQYYVAINFFGVEEIIEALGGADIELTRAEASAINTYLSMGTIYQKKNGEYVLDGDGKRVRLSHGKEIASTYDNHSENRKKLDKKNGVQHLDGLQALMYARLRHIDNDFVRTARTRHLLDALLKSTMERIKTKELDLLDLLATFPEYMITNLSPMDMLNVASSVLGAVNLSDLQSASSVISEFRIPEDGTYKYDTVNGSSVTVLKDKEATTQSLHEFIYGRYYPTNVTD